MTGSSQFYLAVHTMLMIAGFPERHITSATVAESAGCHPVIIRNLFIKLPSGRKLCYWNTRLKMDPRDGREHIVYMGVNQETKQWGETETYGGKLVENITQAIARDCLAISMQRVAALGYNIVMHVHDEMIVDVPIEDTAALERINACMGEAIPWAPGLPLRGDGYETPFYMKD